MCLLFLAMWFCYFCPFQVGLPSLFLSSYQATHFLCPLFFVTFHSHACSALVWGTSVKHQPQKVGKDHVLNDEDVVQIIKKL